MQEIPLFESNMQNIFNFSFTQILRKSSFPFLNLTLSSVGPYFWITVYFSFVCEGEMGEERESEERGGEEEVVVVEGGKRRKIEFV